MAGQMAARDAGHGERIRRAAARFKRKVACPLFFSPYEPFGKTMVSGTSANALQYTGRENDGTGLYYYRLRYHSPGLARFVTEDALQLQGGDVNYYAYVRNNPLLFRDPMGLLTLGQGTLLGCGLGTGGGIIGQKKPEAALKGAITGGAFGCAFGTLIASGIPLPPTPVGFAIGALLGGISGGLTAAATGGTPLQRRWYPWWCSGRGY
ncbi:MAG: RHS repeat-associated core domain-containing protein [Nitrospira sp.]|nr:RHS repeat-associated core domain-containing protein [Nitrospira sp.]